MAKKKSKTARKSRAKTPFTEGGFQAVAGVLTAEQPNKLRDLQSSLLVSSGRNKNCQALLFRLLCVLHTDPRFVGVSEFREFMDRLESEYENLDEMMLDRKIRTMIAQGIKNDPVL